MTPEEHTRLRLAANDASLNLASHHGEEWTATEQDQLVDLWDGEDGLSALAELLGRTREACRERYYRTLRGETSPVAYHRTGTGRSHPGLVARPAWMDEDGLPDWYV